MARQSEPHPETDLTGETIEFEPVPPPEYVWLDVKQDDEVLLSGICEYPVEIRLGQTAATSPLLLDSARNHRELCEAAGVDPSLAYVLVQPDVVAEDPRRGWAIIPVGEKVMIGRTDAPQFRLGKDVAREGHLEVENKEWEGAKHEIRLAIHGPNPAKVRIKSDFAGSDHRFMW